MYFVGETIETYQNGRLIVYENIQAHAPIIGRGAEVRWYFLCGKVQSALKRTVDS